MFPPFPITSSAPSLSPLTPPTDLKRQRQRKKNRQRILSAFTIMLGTLLYTWVKAQEQNQKSEPAASTQTPLMKDVEAQQEEEEEMKEKENEKL